MTGSMTKLLQPKRLTQALFSRIAIKGNSQGNMMPQNALVAWKTWHCTQ
jgi:hypothetical protein